MLSLYDFFSLITTNKQKNPTNLFYSKSYTHTHTKQKKTLHCKTYDSLKI